jgi:hypothetical protein
VPCPGPKGGSGSTDQDLPLCLLAVGVITRRRGALELSGMFGIGLMPWIGVQWARLTNRLWLQPHIFGIGAVITVVAARSRSSTPTNVPGQYD